MRNISVLLVVLSVSLSCGTRQDAKKSPMKEFKVVSESREEWNQRTKDSELRKKLEAKGVIFERVSIEEDSLINKRRISIKTKTGK